jgi:CBS domain-containing protein
MDCGRIFRALLARNRSYVSATQTAARVGTIFALLFAFVGIVVAFSPIMILLALFIYVAATSESRSVLLASLLDGMTVTDVVSDHEPVPSDATLDVVFDRLLGARRTDLTVVDESGTVVGVVTASALRDVEPAAYESTTVASIATEDILRIDGATTAFDALSQLLESGTNVALVEEAGSPVGLVSREDFSATLDLRRETVAF